MDRRLLLFLFFQTTPHMQHNNHRLFPSGIGGRKRQADISAVACDINIIGNGVGIGDTPNGGLGRLLVRGEKNWDIIDDLYPIPGEYVVDKAGKGAFGQSNLPLLLKNLGVTHLVITGITTDVCVHTIMREANDYGYWCVLLKDGTGATDYGNHQAAIKQIKMQGGVFGWVSDSKRFVEGVKSAFKDK